MIGFVPVSDENGVITSGLGEWDRNQRPAEDLNTAKTASSLVEGKRGEIEEAAYLIFNLHFVSEVFTGRDGACGSIYSVLV